MKLFDLQLGNVQHFGVAKDEQDMYERRAEVNPTFDYLPVVITEIEIEGFTINVVPNDQPTVQRGRTRKEA